MKRVVLLLSLGCVGGAVFGGEAFAAWRRHNAMFCMTADNLYTPVWSTDYGMTNTSGHLYCPAIEDSLFAWSAINQLNVHVYDDDNTTAVYTTVCSKNYTSTMVDCSTSTSTGTASNTGWYTLQPTSTQLQKWTAQTSDWPYIFVYLGAFGNSGITGYYISAPTPSSPL